MASDEPFGDAKIDVLPATGGSNPDGVAGVTGALNQRSVLGRGVGEPEEIAHVVDFLGSERSSFMTGQLVLADGRRIDYLSHV